MSADDLYIIRKDIHGLFVPLHGFASDDYTPIITSQDLRFKTIRQAVQYASDDYTEYGVTIHPECYETTPPTLNKEVYGHYYGCEAAYVNFFEPTIPTCKCNQIFEDWHIKVLPEK